MVQSRHNMPLRQFVLYTSVATRCQLVYAKTGSPVSFKFSSVPGAPQKNREKPKRLSGETQGLPFFHLTMLLDGSLFEFGMIFVSSCLGKMDHLGSATFGVTSGNDSMTLGVCPQAGTRRWKKCTKPSFYLPEKGY